MTSIAEFKRRLGFNSERLRMIERGLEPVLRELKVRKVTQLFVNGSFVTAKPDPKDKFDIQTCTHRVQTSLRQKNVYHQK